MTPTTGWRTHVGRARRGARDHLSTILGGPARARVVVLFAAVWALNSADVSTVGASATELERSLHIGNTDVGLLVTISAVVAVLVSFPIGMLADRVRRTWLLGLSVALWGVAMFWSASVHTFHELLIARLFLGLVTATAGPVVSSMIGDFFPSADRGKIYSFVLTGELLGVGIGFAVTGDVAAFSWRAAFVLLGLPAFGLAWLLFRLPEPVRGGLHPLTVGATSFPSRHRPPTSTARAPQEPPLETHAQQLASRRGLAPNPAAVLRQDPRRMKPLQVVRYLLHIPSNVVLIIGSAGVYYYLTGVQTFAAEFVHKQYDMSQALSNFLILLLGVGAIGGVLAGGAIGDALLRRGYLNARVLISAIVSAMTVLLFIPALLTRNWVTAVPYLVLASMALSAQNPPLDAARLDIVPGRLWARAEGLRTSLRTVAQALAPVAFGGFADLLGGGRVGLQWAFLIMLLPLAVNAVALFKTMRLYPQDVANAAAAWRPVRTGGAGTDNTTPLNLPDRAPPPAGPVTTSLTQTDLNSSNN